MRIKRKRNINILLALLILITGIIPPPVFAQTTTPASTKILTPPPGSYPKPLGKAAILIDAASGRVLYSNNSHEHLAPASLTKIMTALLVVENGDLNKDVVASKNAADTPESSIYLQPGETLTRQQLLYACMLPSANDAATALAESVGGSETAFVKLMNRRARQLKMRDTHFCNPHGLSAKGHYTSAYDLALLTRQAMTNASFRQIVATPRITIPSVKPPYERLLLNENRLLYRYQGTIGVKTGYTREAGNCVVGAVKRNNLVLIAVAMNSPTVYGDLEQMFNYGFAHYQAAGLSSNSLQPIQVKVLMSRAATVKAVPAGDLTAAVTEAEKSHLTSKVFPQSRVLAPVKKGDKLGTWRLYLDGKEVSRVDLVAASSVQVKHSLWNMTISGIRLFINITWEHLTNMFYSSYSILLGHKSTMQNTAFKKA